MIWQMCTNALERRNQAERTKISLNERTGSECAMSLKIPENGKQTANGWKMFECFKYSVRIVYDLLALSPMSWCSFFVCFCWFVNFMRYRIVYVTSGWLWYYNCNFECDNKNVRIEMRNLNGRKWIEIIAVHRPSAKSIWIINYSNIEEAKRL